MEYKEEHINNMSWEEFDSLINKLIDDVDLYFKGINQKIDLITPLHRTGGIIAGMMSIRLGVIPLLPVQFKHGLEKIDQISTLPELLIDLPETPNILFCEGNTSTGSVSKRAVKLVKERYPKAKIYLATVAKVYGGPEEIEGVEKIFYGTLTNENNKATDEEIERMKIRRGVALFPWEKAEDELFELNK